MAFGFGFNREKVLAAAEKFVQQGKLQNAISEYEKIIKEDSKDLTVLNTIGDLCARIGQNEQAAHYFKRAGDQYAQDGFTVKAIAIYKKLTRLSPGELDYVSKLAELYTQQGLISDARTQYMHVADHFLKSGDNTQGARVLQRILELDPENTATKSKLADLYLKLGKKDEARNIYYTAAESLYARGSFDAAEEALDRVIKMDPQNAAALMLRGMIAADAGDSVSAADYLEQVPDLDSRPDGLRALLRAKLNSNSAEGLEKLASKLLTLHDDFSGVRDVAAPL
jgi:pilus assembly protein FimV